MIAVALQQVPERTPASVGCRLCQSSVRAPKRHVAHEDGTIPLHERRGKLMQLAFLGSSRFLRKAYAREHSSSSAFPSPVHPLAHGSVSGLEHMPIAQGGKILQAKVDVNGIPCLRTPWTVKLAQLCAAMMYHRPRESSLMLPAPSSSLLGRNCPTTTVPFFRRTVVRCGSESRSLQTVSGYGATILMTQFSS